MWNGRLRELIAACATPRISSLIALCLYVTAMAEIAHQSAAAGVKAYHPSAAVFLSEMIKMVVSIALALLEVRRKRATTHSDDGEHLLKSASGSTTSVEVKNDLAQIWHELRQPGWQLLALPAFLFTIQSNLSFIAVMNLPTPVFQVLQQLKLLSTAFFSVILLARRFSLQQWLSMAVLSLGIAAVQLGSGASKSKTDAVKRDPFLGLIAVLAAATSSGFASTYFERQLKFAPATPASAAPRAPSSLWIRNIQLAFYGMTFGAIVCVFDFNQAFITDALASFGLLSNPTPGVVASPADPFFVGYTPFVWLVTFLQALGGILAALTIKYADNIAKTFASACSIVLSLLIAIVWFSYTPSLQAVIGSTVVVGAIIAFNLAPKPASAVPVQPLSQYEDETELTVTVVDASEAE